VSGVSSGGTRRADARRKHTSELPQQPAFTHLSFSVAFAVFTFCEYIRYFALYPLGATVHLFLNEFLDESKDSGTAVLSHFYLLTGCAGALWLERWVSPELKGGGRING
jgi:hypothetical protein